MTSGPPRQPGPAPTAAEQLRELMPPEIDMVGLVRDAGGLPQPLIDGISDDLEVEFLPHALGESRRTGGRRAFVEGWAEWLEPYDTYVIAIEEIREAGPAQALMLVRVRARTHRDGVLIEHAPAAIFTSRDGKLIRARFYLDRDAAFAAATAEA